MRKEFHWYFGPSEEEINDIWEKGILTVDANVLLDLYRYHESTRNSLISSLEKFKDRLWLSNQAADEFFRNRNKVIVSSKKTFSQASEEVAKFRKSLESTASQLKGNRIIPADIVDGLAAAVLPALDQAEAKISEATQSYPNYLQDDAILKRLVEMFDGAIGPEFKEKDLDGLRKEAESRKKSKVPPGYLDDDKDGDRPYGDFFMWRQILQHSKDKSLPIIFVTSERKEDWWEKQSGQTTGPRQELLKEAFKFANQRILLYQTDFFLEYFVKRGGGQVAESAVEEIRAIDTLRSGSVGAVEVIAQGTQTSSESLNEGVLIVDLHRPVRNFTSSGHFDPRMLRTPNLLATLVESPLNIPQYRLSAGTGTTHDFNVHIVSADAGVLFPVGTYVFAYKATCGAGAGAEDTQGTTAAD